MMRFIFIFSLLFSAASSLANGTLVIVIGAEGEAEYKQAFTLWADRWTAAGKAGSLNVVQIGRDEIASPATAPTTSPSTDKTNLQSTLQAESQNTKEPLWLVLIGHGTFDGKEAKFNLRGPDVTDKELAEWLATIKRPVAIVNCFSASGPFLNRLSAADRVVITATKAGSEYQFSHFGEYLSSAIADPAVDLDKDGQTSLLDAFIAASHRTDEFYKQNGRLATEHALLDDNADGLGVAADWFQGTRAIRSARTGAPVDGPTASRWMLVPSSTEQSLRADLKMRRDELEREIESLRKKKSTIPEGDYYARLEKLMIDLARVYEENDRKSQ